MIIPSIWENKIHVPNHQPVMSLKISVFENSERNSPTCCIISTSCRACTTSLEFSTAVMAYARKMPIIFERLMELRNLMSSEVLKSSEQFTGSPIS